MAQRTATLYFSDIINVAGRSVSRNIENDGQAFICNSALYKIWMRYDWRETLAVLPPFWMIPNEQDHGSPAVSIPANYLGLRKAWIVRALTSPPLRQELQILKDLNLTHVRYLPSAIAYNQATQAFRLFPRVPDNLGSPDFMVAGEYKMKPPKITAANMTSTLWPFDDMYQSTAVEVMKWAAMDWAGDPRAGEIQYNEGGMVATGQLAKAYAAMDDMARNESMETGDQVESPSEPLAITGNTGIPLGVGIGIWM